MRREDPGREFCTQENSKKAKVNDRRKVMKQEKMIYDSGANHLYALPGT